MKSNDSVVLVSGALGLVLLVAFGFVLSDVELEYTEPSS